MTPVTFLLRAFLSDLKANPFYAVTSPGDGSDPAPLYQDVDGEKRDFVVRACTGVTVMFEKRYKVP